MFLKNNYMTTDQIYKAYCNQLDEIIPNLKKEVAKERSLREQWEELADCLFAYADEVKCGTHNQALWEAACQDIEKYKKLKELTNGTVQN
jgi:hypothetical protein